MQVKVRCEWATDELNIKYHDNEWGVPVHNDRKLFEMLVLEGAQAGLSWTTILKKRESYRLAFDGFNPEKIATYDRKKIDSLLTNEGIIRNKLKIAATIANAKAYLKILEEFGSFDKYIWGFVGDKTIDNKIRNHDDYKPKTKESEDMSRDLLARGFKFVGPTICYAFMEAVGMVNDHQITCFRYKQLTTDN
ncbi:MAG TPA: DNA-3-methyladenine glycosylase I [Patescibacteria group bacterium]|nr:DNA-3-methyladenine glycosylase I [Patescibacteria group bacterium]